MDVRKLKEDAALFMKAGQFDAAIKNFKLLMKVEKREVQHWIRTAECYQKLGKPADTVSWYEQAAKKYAEVGHLPKAIAVAKLVLGIDPANESLKALLADLYAKKDGDAGGSALDGMRDKLVDASAPAAANAPSRAPAPPAPAAPAGSAAARPTALPEAELEVLDLGSEEALSKLPHVPLFSDLAPDEFGKLIDHVEVRTYQPGEAVVSEGEPGDAFYAITAGAATVVKENAAGMSVELAVLGDGMFFGEFAYFAGTPRTASVIAKSTLEVLEIGRQSLERLIQEHPRVKQALRKFYSDRVLQNLLRISPLFEPLTPQEKMRLLGEFAYNEVPARAIVLEAGTAGDGLYVIASGRVSVRRKQDGRETTVADLKEGDFFGEMSLLSGTKTTARIQAETPLTFFKLPAAAFDGFLAQYPQLATIIRAYAQERKLRNDHAAAGLV